MVARIIRSIKESGLANVAYRGDRDPAITSVIDEACALSSRKAIEVGPEDDNITNSHGLQPGDMATDGALRTDDLNVSDAPQVASDLNVESTHTAIPE